jgi:hypothetical protein
MERDRRPATGGAAAAGGAWRVRLGSGRRKQEKIVEQGVPLADRTGWAALAPLACAVHCLLAPALVLVAPAFAATAAFERGFMLAAAVIAAAALVLAGRRHGDARPWLPVAVGLALWTVAALGLHAPMPEPAVTGAGGLAMFAGVVWSSRLRARLESDRCDCPACD